MWRFFYTIGRNLFRFPGILSRMRKLAHQEPYSEQESYDCLKYVTGELLRTGHIRVDGIAVGDKRIGFIEHREVADPLAYDRVPVGCVSSLVGV